MRTFRVLAVLFALLLPLSPTSAVAEEQASELGLKVSTLYSNVAPAVGVKLYAVAVNNSEIRATWGNYQWYSDGVAISGATESTFTPAGAHVGAVLTIVATAFPPGAEPVEVTSAPSDPLLAGTPSAWGSFSDNYAGHVATYHITTRPADATLSAVQWLIDDQPIPGETGKSLLLTREMVGKRLGLAVTVSAPGYETITRQLSQSTPIHAEIQPGNVWISQLSQWVVKAEIGMPWEPTAATELSYQWLLGGKPIAGATGPTLKISRDMSGPLAVRVTGSNPYLKSASATAEAWTLTSSPEPEPTLDVYTTPGRHSHNLREWNTTCEPYSQTRRCRTDIIASTVKKQADGSYRLINGWTFNNITYLPSPATLWRSNPLAHPGEWTASDGRRWKTECFATTLPHVCRSFTWSHYVVAETGHQGHTYLYVPAEGWVFNNQVHLR